MKKILLFLTISMICISGAASQEWKPIKFASNENITGIFFLHPDTGFAISSRGKISRTNDAGKTWRTHLVSNSLNLEDLYFINSDTGFVCAHKGGIFATYDGGVHWVDKSIKDSLPNFYDIEMFDKKNGKIIGLTNQEPNKFMGIEINTTDGGNSWSIHKKQGIGYSEIFYEGNDIAYFISFGSLNTSIDRGKNWTMTKTHDGAPARTVSFFGKNGIIAGLSGIVYMTFDGGAQWLLSPQEDTKTFVASQMVNDSTAYLGGINTSIMLSVNGGATWKDESLTKPFDVLDFFLIGNRLYAAGSEGGLAYKIVK